MLECSFNMNSYRLNVSQKIYRIVKALCDFIIALVAVIALIPVFIIVAIAIKIDSKGPVFFVQKRIGRKGRLFNCIKFRSMSTDARPDVAGYEYAEVTSYITKVGAFIRKYSIDELPQFFNILIGNMTFIGPRASGAGALGTYLDDEVAKMDVKPGITGYTQAYYRNSIGVREKRLYDAWYAHNVTLWMDIKIFFKTIAVVLKRENIYTNAEPAEEKTEVTAGANKE